MMLSKRSSVNASAMGEPRNESSWDLNSMISDDHGDHRMTTVRRVSSFSSSFVLFPILQ